LQRVTAELRDLPKEIIMIKKQNFIVLALLLMGSTTVHASLISVDGLDSSLMAAPEIIAAPRSVLDALVTNTGMQGFDEMQGVMTSMAYDTDSGFIAADTLVDSHMIFMNVLSGSLSHSDVKWTFSGSILGVMSGFLGVDEVASTAQLGAATTIYPLAPFTARGMEGGDNYLVLGALNVLRVSMFVTQPGDWIRVITDARPPSVIPIPAAFWLFGTALVGFMGMSRRRNVT
jgi:hypothetical protein